MIAETDKLKGRYLEKSDHAGEGELQTWASVENNQALFIRGCFEDFGLREKERVS